MTQLEHTVCRVKITSGELQIRVAQTQILWPMLVTFAQAQTTAQVPPLPLWADQCRGGGDVF